MSNAVLGWGALFQIESLNSPNDWVTVAEVFNISPPGLQRPALDKSFGNAPNEWTTSQPGMPNASEMGIEFNFVPGGDDYSNLKSQFDDQVIRTCRIVFPEGETMEFEAYIIELSSEVPVDGQMKASAKFQVTGEIGPIT